MASSGYVFSGPGYAQDLGSGKVSLNTGLSNSSEYSKFVGSGYQPSKGSISSQVLSGNNGNSNTVIPSSAKEVYDEYEYARSSGLDLSPLYDLIDSSKAIDEESREWSAREAEKAREFSSVEAQKQRDFEANMSNTSYQRAVDDLIKAGLNPVLAVKFAGASTPSGASAQGFSASGDYNNTSGLISGLFSAIINSATNMASQMIQRQNVLDEISKDITLGQLSNQTSMRNTDVTSANAYRMNSESLELEARWRNWDLTNKEKEINWSIDHDQQKIDQDKWKAQLESFVSLYNSQHHQMLTLPVNAAITEMVLSYAESHPDRINSYSDIIDAIEYEIDKHVKG